MFIKIHYYLLTIKAIFHTAMTKLKKKLPKNSHSNLCWITELNPSHFFRKISLFYYNASQFILLIKYSQNHEILSVHPLPSFMISLLLNFSIRSNSCQNVHTL